MDAEKTRRAFEYWDRMLGPGGYLLPPFLTNDLEYDDIMSFSAEKGPELDLEENRLTFE